MNSVTVGNDDGLKMII